MITLLNTLLVIILIGIMGTFCLFLVLLNKYKKEYWEEKKEELEDDRY